MKKHWIVLVLGAAVAVVGVALSRGPRLPPLTPPLIIHSGGRVEKLSLSPDGRLLADDAPSGQVLLYDTVTGQQKYALPVRTDRMVFSPDGCRLLTQNMGATSTNPNGNVQVWDTATGTQLSQFAALAGSGTTPDIAALSRDLRWAVVRGGARCAVYDIVAGTVVRTPHLAAGKFQATFSPDRTLLAISSGAANTLQVWDTKTWRPLLPAGTQVSGVSGMRFSPDGSRLALGSAAGLGWWDTRTWHPQGNFALPSPGGLPRGCFFFSSDGRSLLVSQGNSTDILHQVDCVTGRETLTESGQMLQHVSVTEGRAETWRMPGKYQFLPVFPYRDTYCVWDTARQHVLYQIAIPPGPNSARMGDFQIHLEDLSTDGHVFAVGGHDDGVIRVWRLP